MDSINKLYTGIQWINSFYDNKEKPKQLLDPITTIMKICILKYKDSNTKIRINDSKIFFSEPSLFQGVNRWIKGDSRSNIHYLFTPILYFAYLKYLCRQKNSSNYEEIPETLREHIGFFNNLAIEGINALKRTYNDGDNVNKCLELYYILLTSDDDTIKQQYETVIITTKNTYREFLKCWKSSNIQVLKDLFNDMEKDKTNHYLVDKTLETIESYLETINHSIDQLRCS